MDKFNRRVHKVDNVIIPTRWTTSSQKDMKSYQAQMWRVHKMDNFIIKLTKWVTYKMDESIK